MADVWILVNGDGEGEDSWKSDVRAVVLPNHRVIAKNDGYKELLEMQIDDAKQFFQDDNDSGSISSEVLFEYLEGLHKNFHHLGMTIPIEEAREYVKLSGGL
jgi:hypothetical protein|tara:strand:+ start:1704 stop:2009 length:306 start_codon:yes stop_codon:yes gene_type:complete